MRGKSLAYGIFICALAAHAFFSVEARGVKATWANVPPVPSAAGAAGVALGDPQLAYRAFGITLQNLGNSGGDVTPLDRYNYDRLGQWFMTEDGLDPRSNFVPLLAAYYFGSTQNPAQLTPVVDYLAVAGRHPYDQKWRWLAQAIYLARFPQKDPEKAMGLANELAGMWHPGMPGWVKQMPAFVALQQGDKEASYAIMIEILASEGKKMHPAEVNFMISYICERLLDPARAAQDPLCLPPKKD